MEMPLDLNAKIRDRQKLTEKLTNPMTPMPSIEWKISYPDIE